jgi:hypothetical protein
MLGSEQTTMFGFNAENAASSKRRLRAAIGHRLIFNVFLLESTMTGNMLHCCQRA